MKTDRPIAQPGWVRRGFIAWLWELAAILLILIVQTTFNTGATINAVIYYTFIPLFIAAALPWVLEHKFPWQMWKEHRQRELD